MIKKVLGIVFLLGTGAAVAAAQQPTPTPPPARTTQPAAPHTSLKVGQAAPDFTLPSTALGPDGRGLRFKLSDFKGKKNVVLAFYVLAFTNG
jgi:AhpC/TSA family